MIGDEILNFKEKKVEYFTGAGVLGETTVTCLCISRYQRFLAPPLFREYQKEVQV